MSSNSRCHSLSGAKACPGRRIRSAYRLMRSFAISRTTALVFALVRFQPSVPSLDSLIMPSSACAPMYLDTMSSFSTGMYSLSVPAYWMPI